MKEINLEWTPLEGARAYRLTVRDRETGDRLLETDALDEPRYALDPTLLDGRDVEVRLEVRRDGTDEDAWEEFGPDVPVLTEAPDGDATILSWEGVSPVHRLVISDQTAGRTVLDQRVLGTSYAYVPGPEERGHDLVMRVRGWRGDDWDEGTEWTSLPLRVILGDRREPPPPIESGKDTGLLLVFTIDTEGFLARQGDPNPETTVDELIFGDFGNGEDRGIGLHMDLLEHFGYRGCFFLDVLSAYQYGEDNLKRAAEAIQARGHEVQLHVHDEHVRNSDDPAIRALAGDLMRKDPDAFAEIMGLGVDVFERLTGHRPIAYRAGGYRITDEHFPVLEELGIKIDTSVHTYLNSRVADWMRTRTQPYWIGEVLELPPTWTLVRDHRDAQETRAFAPNATAGDPVSAMPASSAGVPRVATYVSHSSELMYSSRELSEDALAIWERNVRARVPEEIAEKAIEEMTANPRLVNGDLNDDLVYRVAGLLRRIADRDDARCVTFAELSEITGRFPRERRDAPVDPVPAIDRPHGVTTVTGTRVYSEALLGNLSTDGTAKRRSARAEDDAITALANADVAWKGSEVAVIGDQPEELSTWLEQRGVARLEHFEEPSPKGSGQFDVIAWPSGFERCAPGELGPRLDEAADMLRDDGSLVLRVRTLGVAPRADLNGRPPLSELVFPAAVNRSAAVTAWDAATFSSWLRACGYRIVTERRVARTGAELKAVDRFADKLQAIPDQELQTAAVDFTLRRETTPSESDGEHPVESDEAEGRSGADLVARFEAVTPGDDVLQIAASEDSAAEIPVADVTVTTASPETLAEGALEPDSRDVIVCDEMLGLIELERLDDACRALYRALRPGGQLLLRVDDGQAGLASTGTILAGRQPPRLQAASAPGARGHPQVLRSPLEL